MTELRPLKFDESQLALALNTTRHLLEGGASDSLVFSPLALSELLALLSNNYNSRGMSLVYDGLECIVILADVTGTLGHPSKHLRFHNQFYLQEGTNMRPSFQQAVERTQHAEIEYVDFTKPAKTMNVSDPLSITITLHHDALFHYVLGD